MDLSVRRSGVLLHPTSLPGPTGVGDLGPGAWRFVEWLARAGQSLWQWLPTAPIGPGHSPYQGLSAFAGSPLMVALEPLVERGWLDGLHGAPESSVDHVDFDAVAPWRIGRLGEAFAGFLARAGHGERAAWSAWCERERGWLDGYARFMAMRVREEGRAWWTWRRPWTEPVDRDVQFWRFVQWCFDEQMAALRAHAKRHGVHLVGDLPIFIAHDSADVWAQPDHYHLDEQGQPTVVAGVPPDDLGPLGQRWGNPLYRWQRLADDGYGWWIARMRRALAHFDAVRIDHFRGFAAYWEIPACAPGAAVGRWVPAPGHALFDAMTAALGPLPILAEDLGYITPDVQALREAFGFPGMKILQFAFGGDGTHEFLPHNLPRRCVVYTGTHDNDTARGWWDHALPGERGYAGRYLDADDASLPWRMVAAASRSVAAMAIFPMQDLLGLPSLARMNLPGTLGGGNWTWRMRTEALEAALAERLATLTADSGRLARPDQAPIEAFANVLAMIRLHPLVMRAGVAALTLAGLAGSASARAPQRSECDAAEPYRVLQPAAPTPARAAWIDARTLLWPMRVAGPQDHWRLLHAASGVIDAEAGHVVRGADGALELARLRDVETPPQALSHLDGGVALRVLGRDRAALRRLHRSQLVLVREDVSGRVLDRTAVQPALALDDLFASAQAERDLGVRVAGGRTVFKLWAPTARRVMLCLHDSAEGPARRLAPMRRDERTGIWTHRAAADLGGGTYRFLVDVFVRGTGWVRQLVTDPYSISLSADSRRSWIGDLRSPSLAPPGWAGHRSPHERAPAPTDMVIYELHVRDFSASDESVPPEHRGKYLAFTDASTAGMQHLRALASAGITDVHLLPVFDFATVPERGCVTPRIAAAAADSPQQQAQVSATRSTDCFNWGYDPLHYGAPEGSYASDANDGAARIRELRALVLALHQAGLRVGMDVVYNHTSAAGLQRGSVLDRIVPDYYQRLDAQGQVETSTCCANTATEHSMTKKLMLDTLLSWARHYGIDSFRFDLMGHQPRAAMSEAHALLRRELGRDIHFIGEGWDFGEVAGNRRFRQATQREMGGSGIGTFSDRARDALRGGAPGDSGERLVARRGWLHGAPEEADLVRAGLAGTLAGYELRTADGRAIPLSRLDYRGQGAGYASQPSEVVNYVENHDNQTLFDVNAMRLPADTPPDERARVQILGAAAVALSQGIAYFHGGIDLLRSKSLDRNSFDSGDWFNRLDWSGRDNGFGAGLPPGTDNASSWPVMAPVLSNPLVKPPPETIAWTRDAFRDLLAIRASTTMLRLRSVEDVSRRLRFLEAAPAPEPLLMAVHVDGRGLDGARFAELAYFVNASTHAAGVQDDALRGRPFELHPAHASGTDARARAATFDAARGAFAIPPRTAVVFVVR